METVNRNRWISLVAAISIKFLPQSFSHGYPSTKLEKCLSGFIRIFRSHNPIFHPAVLFPFSIKLNPELCKNDCQFFYSLNPYRVRFTFRPWNKTSFAYFYFFTIWREREWERVRVREVRSRWRGCISCLSIAGGIWRRGGLELWIFRDGALCRGFGRWDPLFRGVHSCLTIVRGSSILSGRRGGMRCLLSTGNPVY